MLPNHSVCASGKRVAFYWRECSDGQHVARAASDTIDALTASGLTRLNPLQLADAKAQVKDRLRRARQGKLRSQEHVKRVQSKPAIDMYEMRWDDIRASRYDALDQLIAAGVDVHVRMYYIEQPPGKWVLGLHVHEKVFHDTEEETRTAQDDQIDIAGRILQDGAARHCGVPELTRMFRDTGLTNEQLDITFSS